MRLLFLRSGDVRALAVNGLDQATLAQLGGGPANGVVADAVLLRHIPLGTQAAPGLQTAGPYAVLNVIGHEDVQEIGPGGVEFGVVLGHVIKVEPRRPRPTYPELAQARPSLGQNRRRRGSRDPRGAARAAALSRRMGAAACILRGGPLLRPRRGERS
jgi:hypothetical protein